MLAYLNLFLKGGVTVDLMSMDKITAVNCEDFTSSVQPGVTRKTLNTHLRNTGLWFAVGKLIRKILYYC